MLEVNTGVCSGIEAAGLGCGVVFEDVRIDKVFLSVFLIEAGTFAIAGVGACPETHRVEGVENVGAVEVETTGEVVVLGIAVAVVGGGSVHFVVELRIGIFRSVFSHRIGSVEIEVEGEFLIGPHV